jgi:cob(I)alamin adenosyltransferase
MKIYTRTGDAGSTGLFGGPRVSKDDDRIEAYGTVDELNAHLGTVRCAGVDADIDLQLARIQSELFSIGAELASPDPDQHHLRIISQAHISTLEHWIDQHESTLAPLKNFILPAGAPATCFLHVARSVCRRAERRVVTLARRHEASVSEELMVYLNRLSDFLFVLSRAVNHRAGVADTAWQSPRQSATT